MAKQELDAVLSAEREAAQVIEEARARARDIAAQAETKAAEMVKSAADDARIKAAAIAKEASEGAAIVEREARAKALAEIPRLTGRAESRFEQAVETVVLRVKKSL